MSSPNPESSDPQTPALPSDHSTQEHKPVDTEPDRPDGDSSNSGGKEEEEEEEEEGECGFCLFMKSGGCKESFVAWENCVDEAEKNGADDIAAKCVEVTVALKKCMEDHPGYYEPILRAEKAAHEEALRELEKEKAAVEDSEKQLESEEDLKNN
ncbi:EXS (ERD1/XPR1/SYG1) family protein [Hibiscus syriacus]|uniref:EXS (ERD1/XPR1/SYG1) family protein n=1 Tax=Hibiscus syriacus TaxID=106335 RepID=A0A6A3CAK1_HIBSY|nr:uncharacterized protein LOC120201254 [Hibiscus syriacus]KAE8726305.1 EXS (ERD1/XPR1/SYG1) family protein [Hibiscus syriacus]